jgi:nicotinate-nucleotide adenylyltransferase
VKSGLALFGGSFNPPHQTHRRILQTALGQLDPTEIRVIPAGLHPHKLGGEMASAEHRLQMCHLAFDDLDRVRVVDLEVQRSGPSYTVDTLDEIRSQLDADQPLYYLIGSDNLRLLPTWRHPERILALSTLVTFPRLNVPVDFAGLGLDPRRRTVLARHVLGMEADSTSSSEIRERVCGGISPIDELHPAVEEYIREHHLYGS